MGEFALDDTSDVRRRCGRFRPRLARSSPTIRPRTLAQASRISGISASDLQNLVIEVERQRRVAARNAGAS